MSTSRSKATKTKSNSHKKLRKPIHGTDCQGNVKPSTQCDIDVQKVDNEKSLSETSTKKTNREKSICKSLENIMNLKNVQHDTISMSKTDISIVYGMYKTLIQKHNVNNEIHIENYQSLLNEFHKIQSQLDEQRLCYKSLMNLITALMSRDRLDGRLRRKEINKANKMMIMRLSQITSVIYKIQCSVENLERENLALDSKIREESVPVTNPENIQKKKKKSSFCSCM